MNRLQLEHLLRAAGSISGQDRVIVIGSQSILGARPEAPASLLMSMQADLVFPDKPEAGDIVDATIGEGSMFHETYGRCAQAGDATKAVRPTGWHSRTPQVE